MVVRCAENPSEFTREDETLETCGAEATTCQETPLTLVR